MADPRTTQTVVEVLVQFGPITSQTVVEVLYTETAPDDRRTFLSLVREGGKGLL